MSIRESQRKKEVNTLPIFIALGIVAFVVGITLAAFTVIKVLSGVAAYGNTYTIAWIGLEVLLLGGFVLVLLKQKALLLRVILISLVILRLIISVAAIVNFNSSGGDVVEIAIGTAVADEGEVGATLTRTIPTFSSHLFAWGFVLTGCLDIALAIVCFIQMERNDSIRTLTFKRVLIYLVLCFLVLVCVTPFYIMIINATRSSMQINGGISFVPGAYLTRNWVGLQRGASNILQAFFNSAFIAISATILTSYFSSLTAYGFTIYRFKGRNVLFNIFVLAIMMVPTQLGLIGFFRLCQALKLLDSFVPLIVPAIAAAAAVFFLRQYMEQVVNESVIQAGRIDGATELGIFHRIILPIVAPGVATNAIFAFVGSWNNYIGPLVILNSNQKHTLPMVIAGLNTSTFKTDFGVVYLAVAISVVPIMIVFTVLSKRIMEGVAIGGTKE